MRPGGYNANDILNANRHLGWIACQRGRSAFHIRISDRDETGLDIRANFCGINTALNYMCMVDDFVIGRRQSVPTDREAIVFDYRESDSIGPVNWFQLHELRMEELRRRLPRECRKVVYVDASYNMRYVKWTFPSHNFENDRSERESESKLGYRAAIYAAYDAGFSHIYFPIKIEGNRCVHDCIYYTQYGCRYSTIGFPLRFGHFSPCSLPSCEISQIPLTTWIDDMIRVEPTLRSPGYLPAGYGYEIFDTTRFELYDPVIDTITGIFGYNWYFCSK